MALAPDLSTTTPVATFSLVTTRANSSIRGDASQPLDEPRVLTVSHESSTNGKVSSAIMLDDAANVSSLGIANSSGVRVMVKIQYNPIEGRTDIEATVNELYAQLTQLLDAPTINKLLNKEH